MAVPGRSLLRQEGAKQGLRADAPRPPALPQIDQSTDPTRVTIAGSPQSLQLAVSMVNDIVRGTFKGFAMLRQIALSTTQPGMPGFGQPQPVYVQGYGFVPPSQVRAAASRRLLMPPCSCSLHIFCLLQAPLPAASPAPCSPQPRFSAPRPRLASPAPQPPPPSCLLLCRRCTIPTTRWPLPACCAAARPAAPVAPSRPP